MLLLWVASSLFGNAVRFDSVHALILSGLLFGIAHAILKPILIVLTLPITVLTLGLFLIVINALILLLVPGWCLAFTWQASGPPPVSALFISVFSFALSLLFRRRRAVQ